MGLMAEGTEWFAKKMIEPAAELGAKLLGRGGKAGVEKAMEKIEPVIAKPKLTPDEAKAFLKAQEEAKAAKAAAEATSAKPKLTPDEAAEYMRKVAEQRAAEKAAADAAKSTTGAEAKGAGKAAEEAAAAEGKKLSWAQAQMLSSRFASKEAGTVGQRARKLVDGGYPEQAEKMLANMRSRGFTGSEAESLRQASLEGGANPLLKKFAQVAEESVQKRIPFTNIRTPGEFIASKWNNLKQNPLTAVPGVAIDAVKVPFLPMIWAGKAASGITGGSKIAGAAAAGGVGYLGWDALKSVGDFLSFSSSDKETVATPGTENPFKDTMGAKGTRAAKIIGGAVKGDVLAAVEAFRMAMDSEAAFNTFRGVASETIMSTFKEPNNYPAAMQALRTKMAEGVGDFHFSDKQIELVDKFMDPKTTVSTLTKEQKEQLADLMEYHAPGITEGNKKLLEDKFKRNSTMVAKAAAVGGGVLAAGAGAIEGAKDKLEDLNGINMLGQMAGIDTSNLGDIAKNTGKSMVEFGKRNPVAAGLGALFGMQGADNSALGLAKKGIMTVIFAGIFNWIMNAMGISSGQVMNMGKGLFNSVLGPVTGQHLNTTGTGSDHTGPRTQYDKKYFPFASEAAGMNRHAPQSAAAEIYNRGPAAPQAPIGAPGEPRPVQNAAPVIMPPQMFQKTYGDEPAGPQPTGAVTSPVAPQTPVDSRPLSDVAPQKVALFQKTYGDEDLQRRAPKFNAPEPLAPSLG